MDLLSQQIRQLHQLPGLAQVPRDFKTPDTDPFKGDPRTLTDSSLSLRTSSRWNQTASVLIS